MYIIMAVDETTTKAKEQQPQQRKQRIGKKATSENTAQKAAAAVMALPLDNTVEMKYNSRQHAKSSNDGHYLESSFSTVEEEGGHSNKKVLEDHLSQEMVSSSIDFNAAAAAAAAASTMAQLDHRPFFYYQNTSTTSTNNNNNLLRPHSYFALSSNNNQISYNSYHHGTTITIILLLHFIYFYQWNSNKKYYNRRRNNEICTNYKQIVIQKRFYTALLAIVSHHPPVVVDEEEEEEDHNNNNNSNNLVLSTSLSSENNDSGGSNANSNSSSNSNSATSTTDQQLLFLNDGVTRVVAVSSSMLPSHSYSRGSSSSSRSFELLMRAQKNISIIVQIVYKGSLSGLPLLTYATHILWQCRALEELYDEENGRLLLVVVDSTSRIKSLVTGIGTAQQIISTTDQSSSSSNGYYDHRSYTTATTSCYSYFRVLIVLGLTSLLLELSMIRIYQRLDTVINFDGYSMIAPQRLLSQQRAMCSIASLVTAVLCVYDDHFPYTPMPILPFIRLSDYLSLSSSLFGGMINNLIIIAILSLLSRGVHPISSILCGVWSGTLWSWGITTFLGTWYWGNALICAIILVILLSLMAQPLYLTYMRVFVPCIDYVAWDEDGNIISSSTTTTMVRESGGVSPLPPQSRNENDVDLEMNDHERTFPLMNTVASRLSSLHSRRTRVR